MLNLVVRKVTARLEKVKLQYSTTLDAALGKLVSLVVELYRPSAP
jgi:hypothetical protein